MDEKNLHYKWVINSTGSNTYGTQFTSDMSDFLKEKGFEKIFRGNPLYGTTIDYKEDEVADICKALLEMRKNYGQYIPEIKASYFRVNMGHKFEYTDKDANDYKNNYIKNRKELPKEEMI